jgi:hypothetical protein
VNGPHRERCRFGVSMLCCAAPRRALFEDERILVTVHMIESQGAANGKWLQTADVREHPSGVMNATLARARPPVSLAGSPQGWWSYLHGHSGISCASSRHFRQHGRLRESDAEPGHGAARSTQVTVRAAHPGHS